MIRKIKSALLIVSLLGLTQGCGGSGGTTPAQMVSSLSLPTAFKWMSSEVQAAWRQGFFGQGTRITIVDDFRTNETLTGNFGTGQLTQRHSDFTTLQASLVAPQASLFNLHAGETGPLALGAGLNVLNLSYALPSISRTTSIGALQQSISDHGSLGRAVVVKSAGNFSVALDARDSSGSFDLLNLSLLDGCVDGCSTIFVGALDRNGTPENLASIASYSNVPGTSTIAQQRYLAVGVLASETGLAGTSFAAPIVSGYAAILGSKFTNATPTQIANQLLNTARTDTIRNYNPRTHGRGEASLANALAPMSLQ